MYMCPGGSFEEAEAGGSVSEHAFLKEAQFINLENNLINEQNAHTHIHAHMMRTSAPLQILI